MTASSSLLSGKRVLAVDDEEDILESIVDILEEAHVDTAGDYETASQKIGAQRYDLVILDIMGVDGIRLLEEAVARQMPAVMLTAHAVNPDMLMESIRKGAISYLPKETLAELDDMLEVLLGAAQRGEPSWKLVFDKLGDYFNERFGAGWKERNQDFWNDFERTYQVGKGISQRIAATDRVRDRGI